MNDLVSAILLLSVPGLPLLLTLPALRARLPWFRYFALLPAAVVAILPLSYTIELPWLLFGIELSIDGLTRLLLGAFVLLWLAIIMLLSTDSVEANNQPDYFQRADLNTNTNLKPVFYLLTMAGNFGAILANDVVSFFVCSTLLGYAFYGLIVSSALGELFNETRRAGRVYLVVMIVADLLLFELLLIAAFATDNLSFTALHQDIAHADSLNLYLWLVLIGFALKAGFWPLHFWLVVVLRRVRPAIAVLLCALPVSIAMLGILRWLPLGEVTVSTTGLIVQAVGVLAVFYGFGSGFLSLLKKTSGKTLNNTLNKRLAVKFIVLISGLFSIAIGTGLADAAAWNRYENGLYVFLAVFVLALAAVISLRLTTGLTTGLVTKRASSSRASLGKQHSKSSAGQESAIDDSIDDSAVWFERWSATAVRLGGNVSNQTLSRWRDMWQVNWRYLWLQLCRGKKTIRAYECSLRRWNFAITLFLLLTTILFFIALFKFVFGLH